jgi:PKD repeat protein
MITTMITTKILLTAFFAYPTVKIKSYLPVNQTIESPIVKPVSEDIKLDFSYTFLPAAATFIFNNTSIVNTSIVQEEVIDKWVWDFGDNTQSNEKSPRHFYEATGSYSVKITLILKNGESKSITKSITYK